MVVPWLDEQAHGVGGGFKEGDQGVPLVPHPNHHLLGQGAVDSVHLNLKGRLVLCEAALDFFDEMRDATLKSDKQ